MKIIIHRQFNKQGDEYLDNNQVEAEVTMEDGEIIIEVDGNLYVLPIEVFTGLLS